MTKPTGVGRGGWRPGSGRKPKLRLDLPSIAISPRQPSSSANGGSELLILHRLTDDARSGPDLRLRRIEQNTLDHSKRLAEALEALQRLLRHQAAIARVTGAIEPTVVSRHTRRRPLGT